jgi:homoserine O-acetyltransferase/O-succinyltransferase
MAIHTPSAAHAGRTAPATVHEVRVPFPAATVPAAAAPAATAASGSEVGSSGVTAPSRSRSKPPVPVSGAWREGDDPGRRQFADVGSFDLEAGGYLPSVRVAYETWGTLNAAGSNAVLVLHALTGDSHVTGEAGPGHVTDGWWAEMVGPGKPIDTDRYFVVAPNALGGCQGTTGPSSTAQDGRPWGGRFPYITTRDQVAVEIALTRELGILSWELVIGASMGGLRVLEWALLGPEAGIEVRHLGAIATTAQTGGDQIAWAHPQLAAIRVDPRFRDGDYYDAAADDGPHNGLGIARQIAHTTYRTGYELDLRFGRLPQGGEDPFAGGRFAVQSYLEHHGDKLARRFDANSYVVLTESMLSHDLGRDRGGVEAALSQITARTLVVAVDSDRLFPPTQSARLAQWIPGAESLRIVTSDVGHDGFLVEADQIGPMVSEFLG